MQRGFIRFKKTVPVGSYNKDHYFLWSPETSTYRTDESGSVLQHQESSISDGNFRALLKFCVDASDTVLREQLTSSVNAVYTSPSHTK